MTKPAERPTSPDTAPALQDGPQSKRRRLLQGGLAASPLLLTLVSRPVLGNDRCVPISSFVSVPKSERDHHRTCLGRTPGFWKQPQKFSQWPAPFVPVTTNKKNKATLFKDWFSPVPATSPLDLRTATFLDVLTTEDQNMNGPPFDVARHAVAALLNIAKGWIPADVMTILLVQQIWASYINTGGGTIGFYQVNALVKLFHDGIVDFLSSGNMEP